ncbi:MULTISPECIES: macrolide family glycosyltransferase [Amycolatopsis]|uniref:Glycosyl transferase n=1 Tax=Amycolatopsis dendrobii TaxID=2760662 RepID=A0A7W3W453_9PSEU|nr:MULTISPECIES: macrolide family glycosyltransferase [Amycolatopsis]MBB1158440.1 glycosyl transferase [Amycolatopsis dendrobii]UKD56945.1 glycosyl transferase [Amycolatopsis sp. FU40]
MGKHYGFVSVAAHGHVNPTLPLVAELVRRGNRVSYATAEPFHAAVRAAGAEPAAVPFEVSRMPSIRNGQPDSAAIAAKRESALASMTRSFDVLCDRFAGQRLDAICGDVMAPVGAMVAEQLGVPFAALCPTYASNETFSLRTAMIGGAAAESPVAHLDERLQEFAGQRGLTGRYRMVLDEPAPLNLVFLPREFQPHAESFDERYAFLGPSITRRADSGQWRPQGQPLLFVSLGTLFNQQAGFFRQCIEAFTDSDWQVAMSVGRDIDAADLGPVPANFEIRPHFPQLDVLRAATAFVSHAGMNSTLESLYFGVPLIAVPHMPEQEMTARQVEELGVGRRLDPALTTADLLRATVDQVAADEQILSTANRMGVSLRERKSGAERGADLVEKLSS